MKSRTPRLLAAILALSLAAAYAVRLASPGSTEARRTFPVLGTFATVIITGEEDLIPGMFNSADSLLGYLDAQLGRYSDEGELHTLNTQGSIAAGTELGMLLIRTDTLVRITNGFFDPTLGTLSLLWGFPLPDHVPDSAMIREALSFTGWEDRVHFGTDLISIDPGTYIDLGAIAKGHAVDRTYLMLREMGAVECLVEVGGEVRCGSSTGRQWNIGVTHPRSDNLAGILTITDGAVATSGDYECFFIQDGVRYSHLLDRRTGYPSHSAAGATVTADDCATADAMATAAAVAGPAGASAFPADSYRAMMIITEDQNGFCETHQLGDVPWGR